MLIVRLLAGMEVGQFETIYNSGAMDGGRSSVMLRVDWSINSLEIHWAA